MLASNRTLVLAVVCLLVGTGVAVAHGNHLTADAQLSDDGTVVVENLFLQQGGYLVLHADDDGSPGEVLGHRQLGSGFRAGVPIAVDEQFWRETGESTTIWATLHEDDGDGQFEPNGDDGIFRSFGGFAGTDFTVGKQEGGKTYVVAASAYGIRQETNGSTVTVKNVSLAESAYVVAHAVEQDYSPGEAVGQTRLEAGVHENVTVELNESFYESVDDQFRLYVLVHEDDGDGEFDPESDAPVTVGEEPVGSSFDLQKSGNGGDGGDGGDGGGLVNTPEETTEDDDSLVNTPTPTGNRTTEEV